ncbi:MAG: CoA transferase [Actinobacteria bacterium]|nr:CoA transferase [Actinomycetota bacterium]
MAVEAGGARLVPIPGVPGDHRPPARRLPCRHRRRRGPGRLVGPLSGVRVVEISGQGPGPWCAMMLSDMGAEVLRVERADAVGAVPTGELEPQFVNLRGRRSIAVDLKNKRGVETVLRLVENADALIEGFRPGVVERLGIGPEDCLARNPRLIYGRMTGWGQDGPWREVAGHDINYVAISGLLNAIGDPGGGPVPPLNLVGDFGGGGLLLAFGIVCALLEARVSGEGQVIDAAMVDGSSLLGGMFYGLTQTGHWQEERGANLLDGGAHFYRTYETADGKWISVGAIEPKFYAVLVEALGLDAAELPDQLDKSTWPELRRRFAEIFKTRSRDEWTESLLPLESCFAPVLSFAEAYENEHHASRGSFVEVDGVKQPAPAPRFSRTPATVGRGSAKPGEHTDEALQDWGFDPAEIGDLRAAGAIA